MPLRFNLGPTADRPIAPLGTTEASPAPLHRLGGLSERFESGGRGPGTVSSGRGDPGGVSYGLYQLASKTGTVADFLQAEGRPWAAAFGAARPGEPAFGQAWQAAASADGAAFAEAQRSFIERTHYRPVVAAVRAQTGLDIDQLAPALRDVCWSCAVQHGAAARIVVEAVAEVDRGQARAAPGYARALIVAIYAQRAAYVGALARRAAPAARATLLGIVSHRYPAEQAAALAMLDGAG